MKYQEFFASRGIPVPQQFTPFANVEIDAAMLPTLEQQYPAPTPVGAPVMPAQPAVAATSTSFDTTNSWPTVFILLEDMERQGGEYYAIAPVESNRHPGLMVNRAFVRNLKFAGNPISQVAYTASRRDANNNVIGYLSVEECDTLAVSSDPRTPGKFSLKLTKGNLDNLLKGAVKMKAKPAFNWASLGTNDVPLA